VTPLLPAGPTPAIFGGLGFSEMLMIAFVAILVFGGRLPEVMRNLGQAYARIRRSLGEMSAPLRHEIERATTLPPASAPTSQGLPDIAPAEVPSVPYEPPAAPTPTGTLEAGTAPPPEPGTSTTEPAPHPWPSAPPAPRASSPAPAPQRPDPFEEPPPV
jgi:sec-independent protein translocase protein TatA